MRFDDWRYYHPPLEYGYVWDETDDKPMDSNAVETHTDDSLALLHGMAIAGGGFIGLVLGAITSGDLGAIMGGIIYGTLVAVLGRGL
jgi:hypothetical protein